MGHPKSILVLIAASLIFVSAGVLRAHRDCDERVRGIREACEDLGVTDTICDEFISRFVGDCRGGDEEEPPLPVDAACTKDCDELRDRLLATCERLAGDLGNRGPKKVDALLAECRAEVENRIASCSAACSEPEPPACESRCREAADAVEIACILAGGRERECRAEARLAARRCVRDCRRDPPDCAENCTGAAADLEKSCLARGGDPAECADRRSVFAESCAAGCDRLPGASCVVRCRLDAARTLADCLLDGEDLEVCESRADADEGACTEGCESDEPPPPESCTDRCAREAEDEFARCAETGAPAEVCSARARDRLAHCTKRCDPAAGPPRCDAACTEARERALELCIARGEDPAVCATSADRVGEECRRRCEGVHPIDCSERCEKAVEAVTRFAARRDLNAELSRALIDLVRERCRAGCSDPPSPPVSCQDACEADAAASEEVCLATGGNAEECDLAREARLEACRAECRGEFPEAPDCSELCTRAAEELFARAIDDGVNESLSRARADATLAACLVRCEIETPLRCGEICAQAARRLRARCLEAGEDEDVCDARADAALASCLGGCGSPPENPAPPPCEERCTETAERLTAACAARGTPEEECEVRRAAFLASCEERCSRGSPTKGDGGAAGVSFLTLPEELCEERGDDIERDCVVLGFPHIECFRQRIAFESSCTVVVSDVEDWFALLGGAAPRPFIRSDSNDDSRVDIADPIDMLGGLFDGTGHAFARDCPDRLDSNDDGRFDIADPIYALAWLFNGGPAPAAPGPATSGHDPTGDFLFCRE